MKFGSVDIPDDIILGLRDHRTVIFAGAGVSMGSPSDLPNFSELVAQIDPDGDIAKGVALDRHLGILKHKGIDVHQSARDILLQPNSKPNELHKNLVKLFGNSKHIRIVTTNFDYHFEEACEIINCEKPKVYTAPALPSGNSFSGIVHVHGDLSNCARMVLSDSDFGRAYLTEGWARRFLIDLYKEYSILFIGYSYDDTIIHYLTHGLSSEIMARKRYAFCEEKDKDKWLNYGIIPLPYKITQKKNPYSELYCAVGNLSTRASRGLLEWRDFISSMSINAPPSNLEDDSQCEQIFLNAETTRIFTSIINGKAWLEWLDRKSLLDNLFMPEHLNDVQRELSIWLTDTMLWLYPNDTIAIIGRHNNKINPEFWDFLCRAISFSKKSINKDLLLGFVNLLINNAPANPKNLSYLAEYCLNENCYEAVMEVFIHLCKIRVDIVSDKTLLSVKPLLYSDSYQLSKIWKKLKPHINGFYHTILLALIFELEHFQTHYMLFRGKSPVVDYFVIKRSTIEDSKMNLRSDSMNIIIDAIRDSLLWIMGNAYDQLIGWLNLLCASKMQVLMRIAIYVMGQYSEISSDDHILWLLKNIDIHHLTNHHEVFNFLKQTYPTANDDERIKVVSKITSFTGQEDGKGDNTEQADKRKFGYLSWLVSTKPDCKYANEALSPLREKYPEWHLGEHADHLIWLEDYRQLGMISPYSVDELHKMTAAECISNFLDFKPKNRIAEPSKEGLQSEIEKAAITNPSWACLIADEMIHQNLWDPDLWRTLIRSFQRSDWQQDLWVKINSYLLHEKLLEIEAFCLEIAQTLLSIVNENKRLFAKEILIDADNIALKIWMSEQLNQTYFDDSDYFVQAINHPAGVLAFFWLYSLSSINEGLIGDARSLPDEYREHFNKIIDTFDLKSGYVCSVFMNQIIFLFGLDADWTKEILVPLLMSKDHERFLQSWDGFLSGNTANMAFFGDLNREFLHACEYIDDFKELRDRFVEHLVILIVHSNEEYIFPLLSAFYKKAREEDRISFLRTITQFFKNSSQDIVHRNWDNWLRKYLESRINGYYKPLSPQEISEIFNWLPFVSSKAPELIELILRMKPKHKIEYYASHGLKDSPIIENYPKEIAKLIAYLCENAEQIYEPSIRDITTKIWPSLSTGQQNILEEALMKRKANISDFKVSDKIDE